MGMFSWDRERGVASAKSAQSELFALMNTLSRTQLAAYGEYRKTH